MPTTPKMVASRTPGEPATQPAHSNNTVAESAGPTHEEIAQRAYQYWEARRWPIGSPEEDWFRAEQDILMERVVWGSPRTAGFGTAHSGQRASHKPRTG